MLGASIIAINLHLQCIFLTWLFYSFVFPACETFKFHFRVPCSVMRRLTFRSYADPSEPREFAIEASTPKIIETCSHFREFIISGREKYILINLLVSVS
uniref:Secreted protein n=1 Tax=Caenorhabditis tropicalis TaxID=1561998 RepID=A0A1I7T1Z2_9PELO